MNKNIIIKKEKPICQLDGLPGVKRRKVDAYSINNTSDIESTIELGYACTSAGDNGAMQKWKNALVIGLKGLTHNLYCNEHRKNFI